MKFTLWMEGYAATGEHAPARFLGEWEGATLTEAAKAWHQAHGEPGHPLDVRDGRPSYWGCRIFDNETDARRAFG